MFLTTAQWIERVKTDMEELTPDWDNVVSQTGGADIDRYIRAKWPEALAQQLLIAPEYLCQGIDISTKLSPQMRQDGSGRVVLPRYATYAPFRNERVETTRNSFSRQSPPYGRKAV